MDQEQQESQKRQGWLDSANNLYGGGRNLIRIGRGGSRLAAQAVAKAAPLLANPATWIVLGLVLLFIIVFIIVLSGGGGGLPGPGDEKAEIPGLNFSLAGPQKVNNGEQILYRVSGTYLGTEDITFKDAIPANTIFFSATGSFTKEELDGKINLIRWKLNDNSVPSGTVPGQKDFWFTITLTPTKENILVENKVFAEASGGESGGGGSGNTCTAPHEGSEYCSVENLKQPFGDGTKALIASLICQAESGSDPFVINDNCQTNDYSVGLFQINLVAHCVGAYTGQSCTRLASPQKRDACQQNWLKASENIAKATQVSEAGTRWDKWGTWLYKGRNPAVVDTLKKCNIQY